MTNGIIRPIQPDDRAAWRDLWRAYLAFYKSTAPDAVFDSTFARLLGDDPRDYSGFVAELVSRNAPDRNDYQIKDKIGL